MAERTGSISVALCTFNGEAFLREQLESIAAQSRPPDELVIGDDGSTDRTRGIVEEFASDAPFPVRLRRNERRLGSTKNFAQTMSLCRGDLIALCDQDDVWDPEKLSVEESTLRSQGVAGVFTNGEVVGRDLEPLGYRLWDSSGFTPKRRRLLLEGKAADVLIRRDVVTGATLLFEARYLDAILPVPDGWYHDGWIAVVLAALGGLGIVDLPLIRYRHHGGNQVGAAPPETRTARFRAGLSTARRVHPTTSALMERFRNGGERLRALAARGADPELISQAGARARHLGLRLDLPPSRLLRFPVIARELLSGRYHRYSGGWRSAGKDLLLLRP